MNCTCDCQPVIQQLQELFLRISVVDEAKSDGVSNKTPFDEVLCAIKTVSKCDICSIWGITIVPSGDSNKTNKYVSLVARDYGGYAYRVSKNNLFNNKGEYVHELKEEGDDDSFTLRILKKTQNGSTISFYENEDNSVNKSHESIKSLLGERYVSIGIPIPCRCWSKNPAGNWVCNEGQCEKVKCTEQISNGRFQSTDFIPGQCVDLIVKMYFKENSETKLIENGETNKDLLKRFALVIQDYVAQLHYQYTVTRKQSLLQELMKEFEKGDKNGIDMKVTFRDVMRSTLRKPYFYYHYATLFIWNPFDNAYHFFTTTAPILWQKKEDSEKSIVVFEESNSSEDKNGSKIKYIESDGGFTMECVPEKKILIYGNTDGIIGKHSGISCEYNPDGEIKERQFAKTMMFVPIMYAGDERPVGILRFMNKKNLALNQQCENAEDYYDCFDNADKNIIESVVPYFALILKKDQNEKQRKSVIDLVAHEVGTPASSARDDMHWLLSDNPPSDNTRNRLLRTIADGIEILAFNAELHKLLSNLESGKPRATRYNTDESTRIEKNYLVEIISKARDIAKSLVREEDGGTGRVQFENIHIVQQNLDKKFIACEELDTNKNLYAADNLIKLKKPVRDRAIYLANNPVRAVFVNLLFNAIKYRDKRYNGRKFRVDIVIHYNRNNTVIEISDFGRGIDEQDRENIFLYGIRGKKGDDASGCGLGLYMARKIIEDFDGRVEVTSIVEPTTFTITLPAKLFDDRYTKTTWWTGRDK